MPSSIRSRSTRRRWASRAMAAGRAGDERIAHPPVGGPSGSEPIGRVGSNSPARDDLEHPGGGEPIGR
eukprot:8152899-Alexandrium_andersonii.AAC.1